MATWLARTYVVSSFDRDFAGPGGFFLIILENETAGDAVLDIGLEQGERIEVASVQGEFNDALVVDHIAEDAVFGVDNRGRGDDVDGFGDVARLQSDVQAGLLLNLENDAALDLLAESGCGDRHLILANRAGW